MCVKQDEKIKSHECIGYLEDSLMIGTEVTLKIVAIRGRQISLGLAAPKTMKILRKELCK